MDIAIAVLIGEIVLGLVGLILLIVLVIAIVSFLSSWTHYNDARTRTEEIKTEHEEVLLELDKRGLRYNYQHPTGNESSR